MKWLLLLVPSLVVYLFASFVGWDFNPAHWEVIGRFFASLASLIITGCFLGALLENE